MDVVRAIRERCSLRVYQEKDVEEEKLETLLECARLAPSATNIQEWRIVVVRDRGMRFKNRLHLEDIVRYEKW
jgi:nitroreductase